MYLLGSVQHITIDQLNRHRIATHINDLFTRLHTNWWLPAKLPKQCLPQMGFSKHRVPQHVDHSRRFWGKRCHRFRLWSAICKLFHGQKLIPYTTYTIAHIVDGFGHSANIFGCNMNEYRHITYRIHFCPWNSFTDGTTYQSLYCVICSPVTILFVIFTTTPRYNWWMESPITPELLTKKHYTENNWKSWVAYLNVWRLRVFSFDNWHASDQSVHNFQCNKSHQTCIRL